MADQITVNTYIKIDKAPLSADRSCQVSVPFAGDKFIHNVQVINGGGAAIYLGDLVTPGICFFRNLGETAEGSPPESDILLGVVNGTEFLPFARLTPSGPPAQFPSETLDLYAMTDGTGPARLEVLMAEA